MTVTVPDTPLNDAYHVGSFNFFCVKILDAISIYGYNICSDAAGKRLAGVTVKRITAPG